jgi:hypothetical protein
MTPMLHGAVLSDAATLEGLALVDRALGTAAGREVFTRAEALEVLHGVRAGIAHETARAILDAALAACAHDLLIRRSWLCDPLLDLRLTLVSDPASSTPSSEDQGGSR